MQQNHWVTANKLIPTSDTADETFSCGGRMLVPHQRILFCSATMALFTMTQSLNWPICCKLVQIDSADSSTHTAYSELLQPRPEMTPAEPLLYHRRVRYASSISVHKTIMRSVEQCHLDLDAMWQSKCPCDRRSLLSVRAKIATGHFFLEGKRNM